MVLHCLLTTSVFLTIVFSPYSLFYHKILVWVIPPLSKVEGLPTLIQWFQNFDNFLEHIVRFNLTPFYARWFLITSTPPLIYYLPHDSMFQAWTHRDQYWFTHILNPKPISSTTLSISCHGFHSLTRQNFSTSYSKKRVQPSIDNLCITHIPK